MSNALTDLIVRKLGLEAELATLKREHEQLKAAAEEVYLGCEEAEIPGYQALRAALDATRAEPVRKFAMGAIAKPESPVQVGYVVQAEPTPLPAWDQSDGVECPNCGGNATLCSHDGLAEPDLRTKLENLRTAAEQEATYQEGSDRPGPAARLRAAIKASR